MVHKVVDYPIYSIELSVRYTKLFIMAKGIKYRPGENRVPVFAGKRHEAHCLSGTAAL